MRERGRELEKVQAHNSPIDGFEPSLNQLYYDRIFNEGNDSLFQSLKHSLAYIHLMA